MEELHVGGHGEDVNVSFHVMTMDLNGNVLGAESQPIRPQDRLFESLRAQQRADAAPEVHCANHCPSVLAVWCGVGVVRNPRHPLISAS
jgi:hypothetical protein